MAKDTSRNHTNTGIEAGLSVSDPKEYHRQYYLKNKEKRLANTKAWIEKNPEKHLATVKRWKRSKRGREMVKRQVRRRLERQKDFINGFKDGPCADCGVRYPPHVMDFHHRDPSQKDFSISQRKGRPLEVLKAEITKCDLLCSNCHRERHHGENLR